MINTLVGMRFDLKTRKFNSYVAKKQGLPTDPAFIASIESWAKRTLIVPPRMNAYIQVNMEIQKVFQEFAAPDDIFPPAECTPYRPATAERSATGPRPA